MNTVTDNIFKTPIPVNDIDCNSRNLVSISATPNPSGGCTTIFVSFHYTGWIAGDELQLFTWNISNTGELFEISSCIDMSTLEFSSECIGRIVFTWNDSVDCCKL